MIHSLLESQFNEAVNNPENINDDGSINWNFVDADCFMAVGKLFKDATVFYEHFNDLADKREAKQPVDTQINFAFKEGK